MERFKRKRLNSFFIGMMTSALVGVGAPVSAGHYDRGYDRYDDERKVVIMHTGDLHGDLQSHTNAREDSNGMLEGGLARAATVIKKIKYKYGNKLIWGHTGDTMSGSAMATFTQGKALIDVWDALSPDVFATGNWEYNYGVYRYLKFFGADGDITAVDPADESNMNFPPYEADGSSYADGNIYTGMNPGKAMKADQNGEVRRWRTIAANAYFNGDNAGPGIVNKGIGELLTDPYLVKTVNGVKIGFIGCTTNRGPQVVSSNITRGISFTNCMGDVKFPQNQPIRWANSTTYPDGMHPNRNAGKEKPDEGGFGTSTPQWYSTIGFRTVPEITKFNTILRTPKGANTKYQKGVDSEGNPTYWKGEGVDIVVLMSEAGIPESIWNAEQIDMDEGFPFPEVVLSSDTHEETKLPVVVTTKGGSKTILIEEGEDGAQVGVLELEIKNGKIDEWEWQGISIDESIEEDSYIASLISDAEAPFYSDAAGGDWVDGDTFTNPFNGYTLNKPLDYPMASTEIILERNRFSHEMPTAANPLQMPAVIEGTLHDLYVDAFRALTGADVGGLRGFRYTNTIMPGPVTIDDVFHSLNIGAMIAVGSIPASPEAEDETYNAEGNLVHKCYFTKDGRDGLTGSAPGAAGPGLLKAVHNGPNGNRCHRVGFPLSLWQEIELSGNSTQSTNIPGWGGGWFWNYSGITLDLDAYKGNFDKFGTKPYSRVTNVKYWDGTDLNARGEDGKLLKPKLTYASYYFDRDYNRINRNQIVTAGSCGGSLSRDCVGDKIKILAKSGIEYGAPMILVTPKQFAARAQETVDGVSIFPLDVVEAIGRYIAETNIEVTDMSSGVAAEPVIRAGLGGTVAGLEHFPRINLVDQVTGAPKPLPSGHDEFGFGMIQPFRGALPYLATPPGPNTSWVPADRPDDEGEF